MEVRNGKTTVWVPKEAFNSVKLLWKPEFNWIPVPVDRSLPPDQIAYIETGGPVSPLPPPPRTPKTPLPPPSPLHAPLPNHPRTPLHVPPLETAGLMRQQSGYFGVSPELETAVTAGCSPGGTERPDTPSTATEPDSPATPKDSPALPKPTIWRQSQQSEAHQSASSHPGEEDDGDAGAQPTQEGCSSLPWKMVDESAQWKMVDRRDKYRPKDKLNAAAWKTMGGQKDLKMSDRWQTVRRDEAQWHGSEKGFAVRLDMHLNIEVELKGTVNGDITLSAEALYVSALSMVPCASRPLCRKLIILSKQAL